MLFTLVFWGTTEVSPCSFRLTRKWTTSQLIQSGQGWLQWNYSVTGLSKKKVGFEGKAIRKWCGRLITKLWQWYFSYYIFDFSRFSLKVGSLICFTVLIQFVALNHSFDLIHFWFTSSLSHKSLDASLSKVICFVIKTLFLT